MDSGWIFEIGIRGIELANCSILWISLELGTIRAMGCTYIRGTQIYSNRKWD